MTYFPFHKTVTCVLIPCLLSLTIGCYTTSPLATSIEELDRSRTLIVCTTDSLFYRLHPLEWSRDASGDIRGKALEYASLDAANEGEDRGGVFVTIPAERITSLYEPGERKLTTTGIVIALILCIPAAYLGVFLIFYIADKS